jgi:hypothetical protein
VLAVVDHVVDRGVGVVRERHLLMLLFHHGKQVARQRVRVVQTLQLKKEI